MAEHVRAVLRRRAPLMTGGLVGLAALGWAGVPALPWLGAACALGAGYIALRHCRAPQGARLRPGAWAGLVLLVLDLALTPWALALALGLRLGGDPQWLLHAAASAAAGALVGAGALLIGIRVGARRPPTDALRPGQVAIDDDAEEPQRAQDGRADAVAPDGGGLSGRGVLTPASVGLTLVMTAVAVGTLSAHATWWWVGATALTAELGTLVALRVGARSDAVSGGRGRGGPRRTG